MVIPYCGEVDDCEVDGRVYEIDSPGYTFGSREPTDNIVVIGVKIFQTVLMSEIYSKSPARVFGKVLPMT